jgi:hypothetical protein
VQSGDFFANFDYSVFFAAIRRLPILVLMNDSRPQQIESGLVLTFCLCLLPFLAVGDAVLPSTWVVFPPCPSS